MEQILRRQASLFEGTIDAKREGAGTTYAPELDGIRGVAVLSVMFGHFGLPGFDVAGGYGVDVFFVLSGYLITQILVRDIDRGRPISMFYWSRCMRLLPALLVVCASLYLLPSAYLTAWGATLNTIGALTYTTNWTRAFPVPGWPSYMAHTWSLSVEEQFYLMWPAILWVAARLKVLRPVVVVLTIVSLVSLVSLIVRDAPFSHLYNGFDARCPAILLGACLALSGRSVARPWMACIAAIGYFAMVFACPSRNVWGPMVWLVTLVMIDAVRSRSHGIVGIALGWKPLVFVGVISYSAYLWHFPVLCVLQHFHGSQWAIATIGIATSLALAYLTRTFVEVPALNLRGNVTQEFATRAGRVIFVVTLLATSGGLVFFYGGFIKVSPY